MGKYVYIYNILKTFLSPNRPSRKSSHGLIFRNQDDNIAISQAFQDNIDGVIQCETLTFILKFNQGKNYA